MARIVVISPLCDLTYVPMNSSGMHLGQDWFKNRMQSWQTKVKYVQPALLDGYTTLQLHTTAPGLGWPTGQQDAVQLDILDCKGNVLGTVTPDGFNALYGVYKTLDEASGTEIAMDTYQFKVVFEDFTTDPGYYYIRVNIKYGTLDGGADDMLYYISEPIHLKEAHKDMHLLGYTHDTNEYDTIFEQLKPPFAKLVPITIYDYGFKGDVADYVNQGGNVRRLSDTPYNTLTLQIGGKKGIPDFEQEKMRNILLLDKFKFGGQYFRKDAGINEIEWKRADSYPMKSGNVVCREWEYGQSFRGSFGRPLLVIDVDDYPRAAAFYRLFNGVETIPLFTLAKYIFEIEDDITDAVTALNDIVKPYYQLPGIFVKDGTKIIYNQIEGENWQVAGTKYSKFFKLVHDIDDNGVFVIKKLGGQWLFDWGDDTIDSFFFTPPGVFEYSHEYIDAGTYSVRFFHNDTGIEFYSHPVAQSTSCGLVTDIQGELPSSMEHFQFNWADLSAFSPFDIGFILPSQPNLKSLKFDRCMLEEIETGVIGDNGSWHNLTVISLHFNALSVASVNDVIDNVYAAYTGGTGSMNIQQFPPAAPTGASLTRANVLTGAGMIVTKD